MLCLVVWLFGENESGCLFGDLVNVSWIDVWIHQQRHFLWELLGSC